MANERIKRAPFRYYVWLPVLRIADMWLRPRTEMLPLNTRWWEYADDTEGCVLATLWGALSLLFLFAAVMGLVRGPRPQYLALMMLFVLLRSAFLGTLENPEPRYTLGVLSGGAVAGRGVAVGMEKEDGSRVDRFRARHLLEGKSVHRLHRAHSRRPPRFEGAWL